LTFSKVWNFGKGVFKNYNMVKKKIAIIGGGACGVAAFVDLVVRICEESIQDKTELVWFEKKKELGYGLAFGTDQKGHILNTETDLMGIFSHEPGHFSEWIKERYPKLYEQDEKVFTPRKVYGGYLSDMASLFIKKAKKEKLSVSRIEEEVCDLDYAEGTYELSYDEGEKLCADYVILALGTPSPNTYEELKPYSKYFHSPWPGDPIVEKSKDAGSVGIMGTSLSGIDSVMTLMDNGFDGKIYMFSPDGLLPKVQPYETKPFNRKCLTLPNVHEYRRNALKKPALKQLYWLFIKDVKLDCPDMDWEIERRFGYYALTLLEKDLEWAEKGGDPLLRMAYALRHDASTLWYWLSEEDKLHFHQWLGIHWGINRHAMPIQNAEKLQKLLKSGKLKVVSCVSKAKAVRDGEAFELKSDAGQKFEVDLLINATGSPSGLEQMDLKLVNSMLQKKMLLPYKAGGAVISSKTMQSVAPHAGSDLYVTGHLANGMLMDVNAVWFNVQMISKMTEEIVCRMLGS
jgi:uncharacterized NAD(P)/FAD-binding protein YdhS